MTTRLPKVPKEGFVYLMKDHTRGFTKIGFTKDVAGRYNQLRTANAGIELIYSFPGTTDTEYKIHQQFIDRWVDGEWFILTDLQVKSIISKYQNRNREGCFYGSHVSQPDFGRIRRVLSKFNYRGPALRARALAEAETIAYHKEDQDRIFGKEYETFTK